MYPGVPSDLGEMIGHIPDVCIRGTLVVQYSSTSRTNGAAIAGNRQLKRSRQAKAQANTEVGVLCLGSIRPPAGGTHICTSSLCVVTAAQGRGSVAESWRSETSGGRDDLQLAGPASQSWVAVAYLLYCDWYTQPGEAKPVIESE